MRYYPSNTPMKNLCLLIFLLPLSLPAQQIITASTEPMPIYVSINKAMEDDRPKDALTHFKDIVEFYKEQGRDNELPEAYFGMALGLALNGHYKESIRYHKKAMRVHKRYREGEPLEIELNLGLTYSLAGKAKKAKKILGQVNFTS
jgi:tetratricopeptide (TPR) repeat protein